MIGMNVSAKSVKDWGEALKLPLIFGSIAFIAWRLFRKKEDYSYNRIDSNYLPSSLEGYSASSIPYNVSFSADAIKSDAQTLLDAFDDGWIGTNNDAVKTIRVKYLGRPRELARLWTEFGMPKYGVTGKALWGGSPKNLKQWIDAELSGAEKDSWFEMFRSIGR